jgi:Dolichyl-phosphate-mannose-protein mannosyltransferase
MRNFEEESPGSTHAPIAYSSPQKSRSEILVMAGLVALIGYSMVRSVVAAASKPFWFDEVCTWIVAHLGAARAIWDALMHAADGQPPLFYLIEGHFGNFVRNPEIAFRIPSIVGFACALVFMFAFTRKRTSGGYALLCCALLLLTILFDTYAFEARPYSLEVACFALALLCYQHAPAARWMVLMGLALAVAQNLHYYAMFGLVPFGAAEIAFYWLTRRLRLSVWLALFCGLMPLLWLYPVIHAFTLSSGQHLLAPASLVRALAIYGWIFASHSNAVLVSAVVMAGAAALLVAAAAAIQALRSSSQLRSAWLADPFAHEHILTLGFLALPFIAYAGAKIAHGALTDRYVLSVVLGFPLAACYLLPRMGRKKRILFAAVAILLMTAREARFWISQDHHIGQPQFSWMRAQQMIDAAGNAQFPVAVSSAVQYLELNHYAPPELDRRLVLLVDPPKAVEFDGTDSGDLQMLILRSYAPMHVEEFPLFRTAHAEFLLLSNGDPRLDWWPARFRAEPGAELRVVGTDGKWTMYLVKLAP